MFSNTALYETEVIKYGETAEITAEIIGYAGRMTMKQWDNDSMDVDLLNIPISDARKLLNVLEEGANLDDAIISILYGESVFHIWDLGSIITFDNDQQEDLIEAIRDTLIAIQGFYEDREDETIAELKTGDGTIRVDVSDDVTITVIDDQGTPATTTISHDQLDNLVKMVSRS